MTESRVVKVDEVLEYAELMSNRQLVFEEIFEIDDFLKSDETRDGIQYASQDFRKEAEKIDTYIKAAAMKIYEFDKLSEDVIKKMHIKFKDDFKTVNNGKVMRNIYSSYGTHSGHYFDKRK
jgi:hypothetical protein